MPELDTGVGGFAHRLEHGTSGWTLLLLHGTGGDEHQLVPLGRELAPEATLLSPRGQVLEGTMPRFFRRFGVGQLDIDDLKARSDDLAGFIGWACAEHGLDPARIAALGYSNGANIAVGLLLRHPGLLRGAALLRPMLPYEPDTPPALAGTDVLIAAGTSDPYSPPQQAQRLGSVLADAGAAVETAVAPAGHELTQGDLARAGAWLRRLTAAGPPA